MKHKIVGIYRLVNTKNGDSYVGQSTNVVARIRGHFRRLKNNIHSNKHLQNAYNKYGAKNFTSNILVECSRQNQVLVFYEQFFMDLLNPRYNKAPAHDSGAGYVKTAEQIENNRIANLGKKPWNYGLTKETSKSVAKISQAKKNKKPSDEAVKKMVKTRKSNGSYVAWNKGLTKETSPALAEAGNRQKGRKQDPASYIKMWETRRKKKKLATKSEFGGQ